MASMIVPPANEKKRVKVYELKNNDWFDRGTGFCTGRILTVNGNVSPQLLALKSISSRDLARADWLA